ncbi:DUF6537 domain-containing protein, partial [Kineococcus glutinatus]|uniref:DUF6537 domain-containing protein n=1 Tax=Kineococcus glutinatus TaxID=1070872 RepID=UPI0031ED4ECA
TAWHAERGLGAGTAFSEAVARAVHRLWAYKDEYEVARLLTDPALEAEVLAQVPGAVRPSYNLHPPLLRAAGLRHKLRLGPGTRPALRVLARGRVLRGTPLDPFGHTRTRRLERALAAEVAELVPRLAAGLGAGGVERAVAVLDAVEEVRGYEDVKLAGVRRYAARRAELGFPLPARVGGLLG